MHDDWDRRRPGPGAATRTLARKGEVLDPFSPHPVVGISVK
jgi:hypothetical protein